MLLQRFLFAAFTLFFIPTFLFSQNIEQSAQQLGISKSLIDKYNKSTIEPISQNSYSGDNRVRTTPIATFSSPITTTNIPNATATDSESLKKTVYGSEIFNNQNLSFEPNLNIATPTNYILSTGDELIIDVWGASEQNYNLTISPDGTVVIPKIGVLNIAGLNIEQATEKISSALQSIYSGIDGEQVNITLSLGKIRSIQINIVGEATKPGSYTLPSVATLFNALYVAGGANDIGSLRSIKLYRNGIEVADFDLYDYLNGNNRADIRLEDNDMIVIEPYQNRVALSGAVKRERVYELKDGESVEELLGYSGGFRGDSYTDQITINRKDGDMYVVNTIFNENFPFFTLQDGDLIEVKNTIARFKNRVTIEGAVWREGSYQISPSMQTLSQLIKVAGGLEGDAFTNRVQISRTLPDYTYELISVDLKKILNGQDADITLKNGDNVYVPSVYDINEKPYIEVFGEVNFPKISEKTLNNRRNDQYLNNQEFNTQINNQLSESNQQNISNGYQMQNSYNNNYNSSGSLAYSNLSAINGRENSQFVNNSNGNNSPYLSQPTSSYGSGMQNQNRVDFQTQNSQKNSIYTQSSDNSYDSRYDFSVDDSLYVERSHNNIIPFKQGMTIADAILLAGGMKESASESVVVVSRRIKNTTSTSATSEIAKEYIFPISKDLAIEGEGNQFVLEPFDVVYIRKSPGYSEQRHITILGEVTFQGEYTLTSSGERLSSVIERAGGFTPNAYINGTRLIRQKTDDEIERERIKIVMSKNVDSRTSGFSEQTLIIEPTYSVGIDLVKALKEPNSSFDPVLREGDIISVPELTNTVKIDGAVLHPNTVAYNEGRNFRYYIENAGGYLQNARRRVYIVYMNGTVAKAKGAKIEPGCEIVVPMKTPRENRLGVQGWVSLASSLTSVAAMTTSMINTF
ncbi:MAG: SLBB domain-containing protein [Rikenellaceae bacterium]